MSTCSVCPSVQARSVALTFTGLKGQDVHRQDVMAASGAILTGDSLVAADDDAQVVRGSPSKNRSQGPQSQRELQFQKNIGRQSTSAIDQRDREVVNIAESITELAELFKDLSALVIDQGTLFDRIDYNVEQMATHVRAAAAELQTATQCVRARRVWCSPRVAINAAAASVKCSACSYCSCSAPCWLSG